MIFGIFHMFSYFQIDTVSKSSAEFEMKHAKPPFYAVMIKSKTFVSECNIGYIGPNCSKQCVYPSYGWKCVLECNCSKDYCNFSIGCLEKSFCKSNTVLIIFATHWHCLSMV